MGCMFDVIATRVVTLAARERPRLATRCAPIVMLVCVLQETPRHYTALPLPSRTKRPAPSCGQDLVLEDVENRSVVRCSPETGSNAVVQLFCSEVCMAEWLFARLTSPQPARVLDPYLSRGSEPGRQPFWYGRG